MKVLYFGAIGEYECYRADELKAAKEAKAKGKKVMVARRCTECGDYLFGETMDPNLQLKCEEGFCGSRPGVFI